MLLPLNAVGVIQWSPLTKAIDGGLNAAFERHGLTYRGYPYLADLNKLRAAVEADRDH